REVIVARLCNFVVLRNVMHPVFSKSRACKQVLARHKARMKDFATAEQLFRELIEGGRMMVNAERHLLRYHHLVKRLEWVNASPGTREEKLARVRAAVEYAVAGLYDYPHCGNSVEALIRSLRGQVEVIPNVEA